ncbi:hypothetical protein [Deinococcus sp.]|uniref:hypothetical protein n=1 Tax=Deinococcus sp. TaxID=47478 RepID=UPI003CC6659F
MTRRPLIFALLLSSFPALAASFGAFQITPRGDQKINLETGVTELPGGGTAVDSKTGLTLVARSMRFKSGQTLSAQGVTLRLKDGGALLADTVTFDQRSGVLKASGHLSFTNAQISGLSAAGVQIYTHESAVVASGGVTAKTPALSARSVVVLDAGKKLLLSGPYTLKGKSSSYANTRADSHLLLSGDVATNRPPASLLKPFAPYLK